MTMGVASTTDPYPYDLKIEGVGVVLKPKEDGQYIGKESKPLSAQPTSYEYGSNSPFLETTYAFKNLALGMGEMIQPIGTPRRYRFAIDADCSINGRWMQGPYFHTEQVHSVGTGTDKEIRGFVRGTHAGNEVLFALAGRKVMRRQDDDTWTTLPTGSDLGTGHLWQQAIQWAHPGASGAALTRTWFTSDNSNLAYYDGTSFVVLDGTHGPDDHKAQFIETVNSGGAGSELWVLYSNGPTSGTYVAKCEGDPTDSANWAAPIRVGNASRVGTWLKQNKNILHIFKEDGIYTLAADGTAQDLYPAFRIMPDLRNGRNASVWLDELYVPFTEAFFKIQSDEQIKAIGTEQLLDNDSEVRGRIVAASGHNTWQMYEMVYNEIEGNSYLLKYGAWMEHEDTRLSPVRISTSVLSMADVHHGALAKFAGKRATACQVMSMGQGNPQRLYIGFDDGSVAWCYLPRHSPNPVADSNCEFTSNDAYVYWPIHTAGFAADQKLFRGFSAFGPSVDSNHYAQFQYRLSPQAAWVTLQDESTDPVTDAEFTSPNRRVDLPAGTNLTGKSIEIRTILKTRDPTDHNSTVVLDGCAIHELVRPAFIEEYTFTIQARHFMPLRDGRVDWRTAKEIRDTVLEAVSRVGTVYVTLPTGEQQELVFNDFAETLVAPENRYGAAEWEITVKATQFKSLTTMNTGTNLHTFTYGELEQYTYGELETIL